MTQTETAPFKMVKKVSAAVLAEYYAIATEAMAGGAVGISHDAVTSKRIARAAIGAMEPFIQARLDALADAFQYDSERS